jgi:hypothetical protein
MRNLLFALLLAASTAQADVIVIIYLGDDPETPDANESDYTREHNFDRTEIENTEWCGGGEQQHGVVVSPLGRLYYFQRFSNAFENVYYVLDWEKDRIWRSSFGDCNPDGSVSE